MSFPRRNARPRYFAVLSLLIPCEQKRNESKYATKLNHSYARFDCQDFKHDREDVINTLNGEDGQGLTVSEEGVLRVLKKTNPNKAGGSDGV